MQKSLSIFILLTTLSFRSIAQDVEQIVKKHTEAIGGMENWKKINSIRMYGVTKTQGMDMQLTISKVHKKAMRQDIFLMKMHGYTILTTTEGWNYLPFQGHSHPMAMTAIEIKNSQDGLNLLDEFMTYKEMGKKVKYVGKDTASGKECYKIRMTDKNGSEIDYFIDSKNYYTVKQSIKLKSNGQNVEVKNYFGNYQKLPVGIVYPMLIGTGLGTIAVKNVEINTIFDMSIFQRPK